MDLIEFFKQADAYSREHDTMRHGQALFNFLSTVRPDLSEQIRSTDRDPFYADSVFDKRYYRFIDFLHDNWDVSE